jgi:hypothetical protein
MAEHNYNARLLRRIAEAADGLREQEVWFVSDLKDSKLKEHKTNEGDAEALKKKHDTDTGSVDRHAVLGPCFTVNKIKKTKVIDVLWRVKGTRDAPTLEPELDSLFWSESAIEKFLLPYYTSTQGLEAAQNIWKAFDDEKVLAIGHLPKSDSDPIKDPSAGVKFLYEKKPGELVFISYPEWEQLSK